MATKTITLELDGSSRRARRAAKHFSEGWDRQKKREWREAIRAYDNALDIDRDLFGAWANRGMCWHQIGRPVEALRDYERAFAIGTPELRQIIRVNRGVLYNSIRRYDEALADFMSDDSTEARLNASYIHLMRGNFWQGLELYRARPSATRWGAKLHRLEDLRDKNVLILHEQGFGDSIQMARFVPKICGILSGVARSCHWTTRTALMPLLAKNFPDVTFSDGGDVKAAALIYKHDVFVLVMDLWQTCGLEISGKPYLGFDRPLRDAIRKRLPAGPNGPYIGLSWRGRTDFANDHNRSASLKDFLPDIAGATFVSLQKDLRDDERPFVFDGGALFSDFAESAALISCLDAVITVDTATAHLAGALGVPTAILLPYAADWRWGESGETTPWYDSVRLFRQPDFGAWAPALAVAAATVRCWAGIPG
jgi:Glycosyltransferase family 9 (heptosyltransferase)